MTNKTLTLSIVIPAYNEELHLRACLTAVAAQTVKPFEVIVVDNGSTDKTAEIARSFSFVRIAKEPKRGLIHARSTGYDAANGDVIARTDADAIVAPDWIEQIQNVFSDGNVDAVSGVIGLYDVPFERFFASIELFFRRYIARNLAKHGQLFLYGGNMAMRRELWQNMAAKVCQKPEYHEDIDLAAHLASEPFTVAFDERMKVKVSARRVDQTWRSFTPYVAANGRVYKAHNLIGRFYMYPVEFIVLLFFPILKLLYKGYDSQNHRFSWRHLVSSKTPRVTPLSIGDV